jgi:POT family proton-dependent oligopeptide transporter
VFKLTYLRKIGIGFFLTAASFCLSAVIEQWISDGATPHIYWQFVAYAVITAAEVMVSVTGLEFSYTQAPPRLKSVVMALWLLAVSAGNGITAMINLFIQDEQGKSRISGPDYYWMFAALMGVVAILFVFVSMLYRERTYTQDDAEALAEGAAEGN